MGEGLHIVFEIGSEIDGSDECAFFVVTSLHKPEDEDLGGVPEIATDGGEEHGFHLVESAARDLS